MEQSEEGGFDDLQPPANVSSQLFFFQNQTVSSVLNKGAGPAQAGLLSQKNVIPYKAGSLEKDIRELVQRKSQLKELNIPLINNAREISSTSPGAKVDPVAVFYQGAHKVRAGDKKPPKGGVRTPRPSFSPISPSSSTSPRQIVFVKSQTVCRQRPEVKQEGQPQQPQMGKKLSFVNFMQQISNKSRPLRQRMTSLDARFYHESFRSKPRRMPTDRDIVENPEVLMSPQYVSSPGASPGRDGGPTIIPAIPLQMQDTEGYKKFFKRKNPFFNEEPIKVPEPANITEKEIKKLMNFGQQTEEVSAVTPSRTGLPSLLQTQQLFTEQNEQPAQFAGVLHRRFVTNIPERRSMTPVPHQKKNSVDLSRMNETGSFMPHWFKRAQHKDEEIQHQQFSPPPADSESEMQKLLSRVFERRKPSGVRPIGVFKRDKSRPHKKSRQDVVGFDGRAPSVTGTMIQQGMMILDRRMKRGALHKREPRSLSPKEGPLVPLYPFHPYTDLQRPLGNRQEAKKLSDDLKMNLEKIEVMSRPAQITARVPTVREQRGGGKNRKNKLIPEEPDEGLDEDFMPEPWEESIPANKDRGLSFFVVGGGGGAAGESPQRTPEKDTVRKQPKKRKNNF